MAMKTVSVKAELAALRGMCNRDPKIAGTLIQGINKSYFNIPESIELFESIHKYMADNGSPPTYRLLLEDPDLSKEARQYMRESVQTITDVKAAKKSIQVLDVYRKRRGLADIVDRIVAETGKAKFDVDTLLHKISENISHMNAKRSSDDAFVHFGKNDSSEKLINSILYDDNSEQIIPTGFKQFDRESGGFARGALVTIGANSGGGKSATASQMAINMASMGYKVLLVPLEMSKWEMTARIMANVTKTPLTNILTGRLATSEKDEVRHKMRKWRKKVKAKGGRYTIYKPETDMTIEEIMAAISAVQCDVVIIDYISLLKGTDDENQWLKLGSAARYAKINAENMNRVNILLCQVDDAGKIRYAGAIKEHSANSWIWVTTKETKELGINIIEQIKSRNSKPFPFRVKTNLDIMRIKDAPMDDSLGSDPEAGGLGEIHDNEDGSKKKKKKKKELKNLVVESDV